MNYYTNIIFLSIAAMLIIQISVSKSGTLARKEKRIFHLLFTSIAIAAFCEWFGVFLQGTGSSTRIIHIIAKAVELSVAPCIAIFTTWIIDTNRSKYICILLAAHAVVECLSGVFGFVYTVDANSNYTHAGYYWIYVLSYILSIIYAIFIVLKNIGRYQYAGSVYYLMVVLFMLCGIMIQLVNSDLKVDYVVLTIASIMLYVFALEMIQQTDKQTELINRRGYENYISHLDETCVILFFDIDHFKEINDKYGHTFGDLCIRKTGECIKKVYAKYGKCFRFGGDEFCVILTKKVLEVESLNSQFYNAMLNKRATESRLPMVSVGYAFFDPENDNVRDKIEEADKRMYQYKNEHRERQHFSGA